MTPTEMDRRIFEITAKMQDGTATRDERLEAASLQIERRDALLRAPHWRSGFRNILRREDR